MHRPILVTAELAGPLAGEPPDLAALLEYQLSLFHPRAVPGYKIDRAGPCPAQGAIPIPLERDWLTGGDGRRWCVARASAPIPGQVAVDRHEHIAKRIGVERSGLVAPEARRVIQTGNSWTKSYRLPLRVRTVPCVRWFAAGDPAAVADLLRGVRAIGKKKSVGYGRVVRWDVEPIATDRSWFATTEHGPLLMAALPVGDHLPAGLIGGRRDYGACVPPLWHPARYCEIICPC